METKDFWAYTMRDRDPLYWVGYYSNYPEIKKQIGDFSDFVQSATLILNTVAYYSSEQLFLR